MATGFQGPVDRGLPDLDLFFFVCCCPFWDFPIFRRYPDFFFPQIRVYPYPLGAGSARPNPKMGTPDPENPLFLGSSVLGRGLRPWSQTMVSEGPDHGVRGRSGDFHFFLFLVLLEPTTSNIPERVHDTIRTFPPQKWETPSLPSPKGFFQVIFGLPEWSG